MHGPNAPSQKSRPGTISCPQTRRTQGAWKRSASFPSTPQTRHSKANPYHQRAKRGPAPDHWLSTSNLPRSLWLGTPPMLDRGYGNFSERRQDEVPRIYLLRALLNRGRGAAGYSQGVARIGWLANACNFRAWHHEGV